MAKGEIIVFFVGLVLIAGYQLAFMVISARWLLLALFALLMFVMGTVMRSQLCTQCMNIACPLNGVEPGVRMLFFARNPVVAEAWKESQIK